MTQRQFKFRAWDNTGKKMLGGWELKNMPELIMSYLSHNDPNIFLMQFTGLKDKNGKEIYEGDIVGYSREDNDRDWNNDGKMNFPVEYLNGQFILNFDGRTESLFNRISDQKVVMKVMGNIYENPELLTNQ